MFHTSLKKKLILSLCLALCSCFSLSAETYQIIDTVYFINGITKEKHLERKIKIDYRKSFSSEEELQKYLEDLTQRYENLRVFDDVKIEYLAGKMENNTEEAEQKLPVPVMLQVHVIDSKNFILLPYYKYDSNDGNVLKAKLKDSDFMGTLNEASSEIYFGLKSVDNKMDFKVGAGFDYNLPFYTGIIESSWDNSLDFSYTIGKEMPEWKIDTGITSRIPFERVSFDLIFKQKFINDFDYKIYNDNMYIGEYAEFSVPIKLEVIDNWGDITYTPGVDYTYFWAFHDINPINDDLISPELLFFNKFSTGRINWEGNFRKGLKFFIKQDAGYNFLIHDTVIGFETELQAYCHFGRVGINSRLYAFSYYNKNKQIGSRLRGIRDEEYFAPSTALYNINSTSTPSAVVLNLDFPIRIVSTDFEQTGLKFLRKLNFELQISPFIDIGFDVNRVKKSVFDPKDAYYCAGMEIIVFPQRWKSLQIRASAGFDLGRTLLKDYIDSSWRPNVSPYEISFGIGLHY